MKKSFTFHLSGPSALLWAGIFAVLWAPAIPLSGQTSHNVEVSSNVFAPDELTIDAGDTVIWTNTGGSHNVNGTQAAYPDNPESFGNEVGSGWVYSFVFTQPGVYDYHCNPHVSFGMTGRIIVEEQAPDTMVINFAAMSPHTDQTLWMGVWDALTGQEVARFSTTVTDEFTLKVPGIVAGESYIVDFYADFNQNGQYDAPPADHAWRLELNGATGNDTLNFVHNTEFTDIDWMHRLEVRFSAMNPHVGQMLTLYLREAESGNYLDTVVVDEIPDPSFEVMSYAVSPGASYWIDFYADHNMNGMYDAPPDDHAWRLQPAPASGDVIVEFVHNTDFTDIFAATSLQQYGVKPGISLYPNPVRDQLHLTSDSGISKVTILNLTGKILKTIEGSGSRTMTIPSGELGAGIYLIKVETSGQRERVSRVVIE